MRLIPTPGLVLLFLAWLPATGNLMGQEKTKEKSSRPKPIVSPLFKEDGSILFQVKAPKAEEVFLSGQMTEGKVPLEKDGEGLWTAVLEYVAPGIHEYSFTIDGVKMVDPGNPALKPMRSPQTSILHIPGDGHAYDFDPRIPHGTVHRHAYQSEPIGRFREIQVYTPPGYETDDEDYPLFVLQHGHSDSFETWVAHGKAHWILDTLIAAGQAKPMIVLMADGHPIPESYGDGRSPENTDELRRDLLEAAIPLVETLYRVREGRENRAICGLSMGGLHSLSIGLNALDTFAWIGAFSAAIPEKEVVSPVLENAKETNDQLNLLWIACGENDKLLEENKELIGWLKEAGVDHEWYLTEGGHSWPVWRGYLEDFAPRLFPWRVKCVSHEGGIA